ncbi:hypothetical protein Hanom_Chr06g00550451 [Helianthus anomalus]
MKIVVPPLTLTITQDCSQPHPAQTCTSHHFSPSFQMLCSHNPSSPLLSLSSNPFRPKSRVSLVSLVCFR